MLDHLIMLRHASYDESQIDGPLNDSGRLQIKQLAYSILSKSLPNFQGVRYIASNQKRAIQSAMFLSKELGTRCLPQINGDLWTKREDPMYGVILRNFYEDLSKQEGSVIVLGHKEMFYFFPDFLASEGWTGQKSLGKNCGEGYYFNFKNKTYEPLTGSQSQK